MSTITCSAVTAKAPTPSQTSDVSILRILPLERVSAWPTKIWRQTSLQDFYLSRRCRHELHALASNVVKPARMCVTTSPFLNSCLFTNSVSNPSMSETETHKERISCLSTNSWSERSGQKRTCFHENENVTRCQSQEQLRALNSVVDILLTTRAYTNPVRSRSNQNNKTVTLATLLLRGCFVRIGFSLCLIVKDRQRMCQAKQPKVICLPKI